MKCLVVLTVLYFAIFKLANCTKVSLKGRIVGGIEVSIDKYPYQVSVRLFGKHICGGAIVSKDIIITAAHCTDGQTAKSLSIRHGSTYADYGKEHVVKRIIQNPDFDPNYFDSDISLLEIGSPIVFSRSSQPVVLAQNRSADNSNAVICGWGVLFENDDTSNLGKQSLRAVTVKVVNREDCQRAYRSPQIELCAAAPKKDSCQGDSGGALIDEGTQQMIGISSLGDGCAKVGKPGVYTSVPDMMKFIQANMQNY